MSASQFHGLNYYPTIMTSRPYGSSYTRTWRTDTYEPVQLQLPANDPLLPPRDNTREPYDVRRSYLFHGTFQLRNFISDMVYNHAQDLDMLQLQLEEKDNWFKTVQDRHAQDLDFFKLQLKQNDDYFRVVRTKLMDECAQLHCDIVRMSVKAEESENTLLTFQKLLLDMSTDISDPEKFAPPDWARHIFSKETMAETYEAHAKYSDIQSKQTAYQARILRGEEAGHLETEEPPKPVDNVAEFACCMIAFESVEDLVKHVQSAHAALLMTSKLVETEPVVCPYQPKRQSHAIETKAPERIVVAEFITNEEDSVMAEFEYAGTDETGVSTPEIEGMDPEEIVEAEAAEVITKKEDSVITEFEDTESDKAYVAEPEIEDKAAEEIVKAEVVTKEEENTTQVLPEVKVAPAAPTASWSPPGFSKFTPPHDVNKIPTDHTETFSFDLIQDMFGGEEWFPGFYFEPRGLNHLNCRSYWLLSGAYDPFIPSELGEHGAVLKVFDNKVEHKAIRHPTSENYKLVPVFRREKGSTDFRYMGLYTRTHRSHKIDFETQNAVIPDTILKHWAKELAARGRADWVTLNLIMHFFPPPKVNGKPVEQYKSEYAEWQTKFPEFIKHLTETNILKSFYAPDTASPPGLRLSVEYMECEQYGADFYEFMGNNKNRREKNLARGNNESLRRSNPIFDKEIKEAEDQAALEELKEKVKAHLLTTETKPDASKSLEEKPCALAPHERKALANKPRAIAPHELKMLAKSEGSKDDLDGEKTQEPMPEPKHPEPKMKEPEDKTKQPEPAPQQPEPETKSPKSETKQPATPAKKSWAGFGDMQAAKAFSKEVIHGGKGRRS